MVALPVLASDVSNSCVWGAWHQIKSNGDVVVNSGGSKGADMLAALNYVCQQIRVKIAVTDEGEWSIQHVDGRWQQRFTDQL